MERCLEENPDIEAVLITSPTYDGVVSDVRRIADVAHSYGIPLIVDEAHGAHFRFSDYFPASAVDLGADVVIQSFHKTLPAMTQTAVLHLCSDRVSEKLICRFLGIYETSSPSYILMSSLDACVAKLEKDSGRMFDEFAENLETARKQLSNCEYIRLFQAPDEKSGEKDAQDRTEIFAYDRSKLIFINSPQHFEWTRAFPDPSRGVPSGSGDDYGELCACTGSSWRYQRGIFAALQGGRRN